MKNFSLGQFKRYIELHSFTKFIYSSENQSYANKDICKISAHFCDIDIFINPNNMVFRNESISFVFENIISIDLIDDKFVLGDVFAINYIYNNKRYKKIFLAR